MGELVYAVEGGLDRRSESDKGKKARHENRKRRGQQWVARTSLPKKKIYFQGPKRKRKLAKYRQGCAKLRSVSESSKFSEKSTEYVL